MKDIQKLALGLIVAGLFMGIFQNYLTTVMNDQIRTEKECLSDFDLQSDIDICLQGVEEWNNELLPNIQLRDNIWFGFAIFGIIIFVLFRKESKE